MANPTMTESIAARKATSQQLTDARFWGAFGDSLSAAASYPYVWVNALRDQYGFTLLDGGAAGETSAQVLTRMQALTTAQLRQVKSLWVGANADGGGFSATLTNIAAMVLLMHNAGNDDCIIIGQYSGEFGAPSYAPAGASYLAIQSFNASLLSTYGARFLDPGVIMAAHGDGSANDLLDISRGVVPRSLRADSLHPNAAGHAWLLVAIKAKYDANTAGKLVTIDQAPGLFADLPYPSVVSSDFTSPASGGSAGTTNFFGKSLPAGFFEKNGRTAKIKASGSHANAAATKELKIIVYDDNGPSFGYLTALTSGALTSSATGFWDLELTLTRISTTSFKYSWRFTSTGYTSGSNLCGSGTQTGVDFSQAITCSLQGVTVGTTTAGDLTQTEAVLTKELRA